MYFYYYLHSSNTNTGNRHTNTWSVAKIKWNYILNNFISYSLLPIRFISDLGKYMTHKKYMLTIHLLIAIKFIIKFIY